MNSARLRRRRERIRDSPLVRENRGLIAALFIAWICAFTFFFAWLRLLLEPEELPLVRCGNCVPEYAVPYVPTKICRKLWQDRCDSCEYIGAGLFHCVDHTSQRAGITLEEEMLDVDANYQQELTRPNPRSPATPETWIGDDGWEHGLLTPGDGS